MPKQIRLNAFEMNTVGDQSPGLWAHPRDRSAQYTDLGYWTGLAKTLERGKFDGIFLADVLGVYDVFGGSPDAALRNAAQTPCNDPMLHSSLSRQYNSSLRTIYTLDFPEAYFISRVMWL